MVGGIIPCTIMLLGLFLIPESPRWLAKMGNKKGFEVALRKLRGKDSDISAEADEIQDYIETLEKLPKANILDLFQRRYMRPVIIGVGLMFAQQFGGINGILFYASSIFELAGFPPKVGTVILSVIPIVMVTTSGSLFIDKAGRKPLLLVSASGLFLGCILTAVSFYFLTYQIALKAVPSLAMTGLLLFVCSYEIGMGAVPSVVMSEIFPLNAKGIAGSLAMLVNWSCAWVVSYNFNFLMTWSSYGLIPCGIMLFGLFLIPESPRWLAKTGNKKGFEVALRKLRGKDADISEEAVEIQDYIETLEKLPKANILDLFQRRYLRSVIIGLGLMTAQMFVGINAIVFYASSIFESAGFPSNMGVIVISILPIVVVIMAGSLFIEQAGRKPLLLVSGSGLVIGCLLTALSFYFTTYKIAVKAAPALALTGLLVYVGFFSTGMGPVPWVVMSEIFPINVKGSAGSLAALAYWLSNWVVSYSFNFLMAWSSYGTFLLYAGVNMLVILFVMKVVPETKGKTLEQIQTAINSQ